MDRLNRTIKKEIFDYVVNSTDLFSAVTSKVAFVRNLKVVLKLHENISYFIISLSYVDFAMAVNVNYYR